MTSKKQNEESEKTSDAPLKGLGAITIGTRLTGRGHHNEIRKGLAVSLSNRGACLAQMGKLHEALADHDNAITILTQLVKEEGREDLVNALAFLLRNREEILRRLGKQDQASAALKEAFSLVQ